MYPEDGAAPAAAEPIAAPADTAQPGTTAAEPAIERSKEPARASIDRAFAELDKQDAAAGKPVPKEQVSATDTRDRDESGRFKAKDVTAAVDAKPPAGQETVNPGDAAAPKPVAAIEPPARFSADAKAAWKDAPEPIKAEINRAVKELEGGLAQYQQAFEPLKPYMQLAKQHGTTVHEAMERYVGIERALQDPQQRLAALQDVFETAGVSPRDYAAYILGQPADQAQSQSDATIRELRQELATLKQQIGGVTTSLQQQREKDTRSFVEKFAADHPRLNDQEFGSVVSKLLSSGMAEDLQSAYDMAERLNPVPTPAVDTQSAAIAALTKPNPDQTRKGQLSIAGAPASGSNPATRKPPASARESLDRAFGALGIG